MSTNTQGTRDRYGEVLAQLAAEDPRIVALDCDLGRSTKSFSIASVDEARFFEMGIAEQDMVSTAAGMVSMGKVPFANTMSIFLTNRAFGQIRQQVALPKSNVKLCGSSSGISHGVDGATHQTVEDVSLMRTLPNMTVMIPADCDQAELMIRDAVEIDGPVYLRLSRIPFGTFLPRDKAYQSGKIQVLKEGGDILLVSCGPITKFVLEAGDILDQNGMPNGVVNVHTLKPFDTEGFKSLYRSYRYVFTVEEHNVIGGLGSLIAETIGEDWDHDRKTYHMRLGVKDVFGESATTMEMLHTHGLDTAGIVDAVTAACGALAGST